MGVLKWLVAAARICAVLVFPVTLCGALKAEALEPALPVRSIAEKIKPAEQDEIASLDAVIDEAVKLGMPDLRTAEIYAGPVHIIRATLEPEKTQNTFGPNEEPLQISARWPNDHWWVKLQTLVLPDITKVDPSDAREVSVPPHALRLLHVCQLLNDRRVADKTLRENNTSTSNPTQRICDVAAKVFLLHDRLGRTNTRQLPDFIRSADSRDRDEGVVALQRILIPKAKAALQAASLPDNVPGEH